MNNSAQFPKFPSFIPFFTLSIITLSFLILGCSSTPSTAPTPTLSTLETQGKDAFNLYCATCHSINPNVVIVGPSLAGIATSAGERVPGEDTITYLQTSILKPNAYIVPGFPDSMLPDIAKQLTGEDFDAVIAYLLTLK